MADTQQQTPTPEIVKLSQVQANSANPRSISGAQFQRLVDSLLVLPNDAIGNRLAQLPDFVKKTKPEQEALLNRWLTWRDAPTAVILRADKLTDAEAREFIIKDNVGFGEWDYDALANEWDEAELKDWGLDVWQPDESAGVSPDDYSDDFTLPDGDKSNVETVSFTLTSEQAELVKEQLKVCQQEVGEFDDADTFGNSNKNGNAIYKIVKQWADAKR